MDGMPTKPVVGIISAFLDDTVVDSLVKRCPSASFVVINHSDISAERLQDIEILLAEPSCIWNWLYELPKLKWIQSTCAGVNEIFEHLLPEKPAPSYVLTKFAGVLGPHIAEYVVGHIIARERKFALAEKYQQSKEWPSWEVLDYRSLSELTIGILGLGDIGQEIAKYCKSMKMTVNAIHRAHPATKLPYVDECFCLENLPECLKNCDYLCSVLPSTPSTKGLLSGSVLESCKEKKTVLINVGRGDVIRSEEILQALNNQWIGGAILDVFEEEPLPKDSALWTHPEVTITPHVAGLSPRSQVIEEFVKNFELYKAGKPLKYAVDWSKGY